MELSQKSQRHHPQQKNSQLTCDNKITHKIPYVAAFDKFVSPSELTEIAVVIICAHVKSIEQISATWPVMFAQPAQKEKAFMGSFVVGGRGRTALACDPARQSGVFGGRELGGEVIEAGGGAGGRGEGE